MHRVNENMKAMRLALFMFLVVFSIKFLIIFTVRRYALHGICDSNSVCVSVCLSVRLSVCHTRGLCPHGSTYDHDFFTTG